MYSSLRAKALPASRTSGSRIVLQVDLISVERVVKMARADGVFGQDQRTVARVPEGQRPITDQSSKAVGPPLFVRCRDDGQVRGIDGYEVTQIADEISAIIQAAVEGDDRAGRRNTWLFLSIRFLGCVESAIEDFRPPLE